MKKTAGLSACALVLLLGACTSDAKGGDDQESSAGDIGETKEFATDGLTFEVPEEWEKTDGPVDMVEGPGEGGVHVLAFPTEVANTSDPEAEFADDLGPMCEGKTSAEEGIELDGATGWDLRCDEGAQGTAIRELAVEHDGIWYQAQFSFGPGTEEDFREAVVDAAVKTWSFS